MKIMKSVFMAFMLFMSRLHETAAQCPGSTSRSGTALKLAPSNGIRSSFCARLQPRNRGEQRLRVRMRGRVEHALGRRQLDEPAAVHHGDPIADLPDQAQVVRDEEVGQAEPLLQIEQQVDHLRLDRDVERRDGLVGDDERRLERERAREPDALPLAAAELVRILRGRRPGRARRARRAARTRARRSSRLPSLWMTSGSSTMSPTRMRGLSDEYGSWNTI